MRTHRHHLAALVLAFTLAACGGNAPPSLSPDGVKVWRANQAVVVVGDLQTLAIQLNGIRNDQGVPVLSDTNTRAVIDIVEVAIKSIQVSPTGWKAIATQALTELDPKLDAYGQAKLRPYIAAAQAVLAEIEGGQ